VDMRSSGNHQRERVEPETLEAPRLGDSAAKRTTNEKARQPLTLSKKLAFAAISVVLLWGVCEAGLRLAGIAVFPTTPYADSDYEVEWELKRNFKGTWAGVNIKTDSLGLRDDEIPLEKPPGEFRILCLGDSVTFGYRLEEPQTFVAQLEALLNKHYEMPHFQVINAGIDGYSTFQEFHFLKKRGLALQPDLILVCFVLNDVTEQFRTMASLGGAGHYAGAGRKSLARSVVHLLNKSAVYTAVKLLYVKLEGMRRARLQQIGNWRYRSLDDIFNEGELFRSPLRPEIEAAWEYTKTQVLQLSQLARDNGIPVLVFVPPYAGQVEQNGLGMEPQQVLARFCLRHRIPFYDLSSGFLASPNPEALFLDGGHYNPDGSRLIAQMLFQKLAANDTLFKTGDDFYAAFEAEMKQAARGNETSHSDKENL
jgi:lysophospholipase L1-like esterase